MSELQTVPPLSDGRPETGPMQFGDDWPGVFIRGDNAFGYAVSLATLLTAFDDGAPANDMWIQASAAKGLLKLLRSCDVRVLRSPAPLTTENENG